MAITSKGIFYPTSGDQVAPLEAVFAAVSSSVDNAIPLSGISPLQFNGTGAGSSQVLTVVFDNELPLAPNKIQATVRGPVSGSSSYVATVTNSSTTGFTVILYRLNAGSSQAINTVWSVMN
jgi:hypothetical protein